MRYGQVCHPNNFVDVRIQRTYSPFSWQRTRSNCEFSYFQADPACIAITWSQESYPVFPLLRFLMRIILTSQQKLFPKRNSFTWEQIFFFFQRHFCASQKPPSFQWNFYLLLSSAQEKCHLRSKNVTFLRETFAFLRNLGIFQRFLSFF